MNQDILMVYIFVVVLYVFYKIHFSLDISLVALIDQIWEKQAEKGSELSKKEIVFD